MKKITVILPIHRLDGNYKEMFNYAIESLNDFHNDVKLAIVCPNDKNITDELSSNFTSNLEIVTLTHSGPTDFCSQVNHGIENCDTEWFSILEIDDVYKSVWLKSMNEYITIYPDVSVFLPIVKDIDVNGKFLSFTNESTWAYGFSERQGFLDNEVLLDFQNYQTSGGLYKTQVIKDNGLFKENIILTFSYEFLLRLTHNGVAIMTVPKIGYQHVNFREDSLFWSYQNNDSTKLSEKEAKFWLETSKKEFFFKNKRDVDYVEA
jgi:hypothetical protein